ncbi:MAG: trimethylamine methyltransferase family protein [Hyphomicrobiaceae bacterium]
MTAVMERAVRRGGRSRAPEGGLEGTAFVSMGQARRPEFSLLGATAVEQCVTRAKQLLSDYGVVIIHQGAAKAMLAAGAKPGRDANRYTFPAELIAEALHATPKSVTLCGKTPSRDMPLPRGDRGFVMRTGTGAHGFIDAATNVYRNMTLDDVGTIAQVASQLDQVGFIAHPFVHGVPEITADIHSFAKVVTSTDKHCWIQPYNKENVSFLLQIAAAAAGGEAALKARPIASCIVCSFTPLEFKVMDLEAMITCGRYGVPIHACSLPSAGGTAPLTVPGLVLMAVTEILAMVVMAHILAPGTPVIATPLMFTLDMRTGRSLLACVESLQAAGMAIEVVKRGLGLVAHTYGAGSDTPDLDVQSMTERALLGQTVALAGADILGGVGQLECATVFSPVQAVLDNEVGGMLRRYIRMPEANDETFDWPELSTIRAGGHFLDSRHTLRYCRDQLVPEAFMRQGRDDYEKSGRRTAADAARDICLAHMAKAPPEGIPSETQRQDIAGIVADADRYILDLAAKNAGARAEI